MRSSETSTDSIFTDDFLNKIAEENRRKIEAEIRRPKLKSESIYNNEIGALEEPLKALLLQLKDNLESGKYNLLIGEDASGRIPTLIMKKVVDHIYEQNDFAKPPLKFVAGKKGVGHTEEDTEFDIFKYEETIKTLANDFKKFSGQKALIVTEYMHSGESIKRLEELFSSFGVETDVATLSSLYSNYSDRAMLSKVYSGEEGQRYPSNGYGRYNLGGVHKNASEPYAKPHRLVNRAAANLTEARSDVENVAKNLIKWYDSETKEN